MKAILAANWRLLGEVALRALLAGAIVEVGGLIASALELIRVLPGTVSVPAWCLFTNYYYAMRRDAADGCWGAILASVVIALLFVGVALAIELAYGHFVPWTLWATFVMSLLIFWGGVWDRSRART